MTTPVPEKHVQAAIVELLQTIGARVWVLGTRRARGDDQGTRQTSGLPDLWVVIPPRPSGSSTRDLALWIEVKAERGRLRPAQRIFRDACARAGVMHLVGGVDVVLAFLQHGGWVR